MRKYKTNEEFMPPKKSTYKIIKIPLNENNFL